MLTCIIFGNSNGRLVEHTLECMLDLKIQSIIVATNEPCETIIQKKYQTSTIRFVNNRFKNINEAFSASLKWVNEGRVLFLEAGSTPTQKSIEVHKTAANSKVICGLVNRVFTNCYEDSQIKKPYSVEDYRLKKGQKTQKPWLLFENNNTSIDISVLRDSVGFDTVFCVDGVTENTDFAYSLYKMGFSICFSEEAGIECEVILESTQIEPRLRSLYIWITDACNYACKMCRIGQHDYSANLYKEPTFETIKELILSAKNFGVSKIEFFGGEIFLRKDILLLFELCIHLGLEVGFVTNGSLITYEVSKQLHELGIVDVPVSLDAPIREVNDWIRGTRAWERTIEGINNLKKNNVSFSIFMVVMKQNFRYMSDMIRFAKKLGAKSISFQPVSSRQGGTRYINLAMDYSEINELKKEIIHSFEIAEQLGVSIRSRKMLKSIPEYFLRDEKLHMKIGCTIPLKEAVYTRTRKLQLCFTSYGDVDLYKKADSKNFLDVWNSDEYQILREIAATGRCPGCLANCSDIEFLYND